MFLQNFIVEIWLGIANGQSSSIFDSPPRVCIFRFRAKTLVSIYGFAPNLIYALILWRSGLVLLMGKFRQLLIGLSARHTSVCLLPYDTLSKYKWIFAKLGMCIDIVEIWFEIVNGQSSLIFVRVIGPPCVSVFVSGQ